MSITMFLDILYRADVVLYFSFFYFTKNRVCHIFMLHHYNVPMAATIIMFMRGCQAKNCRYFNEEE